MSANNDSASKLDRRIEYKSTTHLLKVGMNELCAWWKWHLNVTFTNGFLLNLLPRRVVYKMWFLTLTANPNSIVSKDEY